jgi:hypothetical protein
LTNVPRSGFTILVPQIGDCGQHRDSKQPRCSEQPAALSSVADDLRRAPTPARARDGLFAVWRSDGDDESIELDDWLFLALSQGTPSP